MKVTIELKDVIEIVEEPANDHHGDLLRIRFAEAESYHYLEIERKQLVFFTSSSEVLRPQDVIHGEKKVLVDQEGNP